MASSARRDDDTVDIEAAHRDAVAQESAEVLRHQLRCEREASVRMGRGDLLLSFFVTGVGFGVGWAGASGWFGKRRRRRSR